VGPDSPVYTTSPEATRIRHRPQGDDRPPSATRDAPLDLV
jgi:hypothetical protein